MTAAVSTGSPASDHGLRPFDARRDMGALADLIETAFAEQLDPAGRQMVAGMRLLARFGWFGAFLGRWLLPPAAKPTGVVWQEGGRVVGNASLMPVRNYSQRWVMANVAVLPAYRQRGIAGQLVRAAIETARARGALQVILQVDRNNEAACTLYRHFNFGLLSDRTTWTRRRGLFRLGTAGCGRAEPRQPEAWRQQFALAHRLHPEGLIWPFPTVSSMFRPQTLPVWSAGSGTRHWVWRRSGELLGSLSLRPGVEPGLTRLVMFVASQARGEAEAELLDCALDAAGRSRAMILDYPTGEAVDALRQRGFEQRRQLLWMGLELKPGGHIEVTA